MDDYESDIEAQIAELDDWADYREIFGRNPEPWRVPLGALRLTLAADVPQEWDWERARDECEELVKVLNGVTE